MILRNGLTSFYVDQGCSGIPPQSSSRTPSMAATRMAASTPFTTSKRPLDSLAEDASPVDKRRRRISLVAEEDDSDEDFIGSSQTEIEDVVVARASPSTPASSRLLHRRRARRILDDRRRQQILRRRNLDPEQGKLYGS